MSKEIAKKEKIYLNIEEFPILDPERIEDFKESVEEMDGKVNFGMLQRITMPKGGIKVFNRLDEDGEEYETEEIKGIIIFAHESRTYFMEGFTGESTLPTCTSPDNHFGYPVDRAKLKAKFPKTDFFNDATLECADCPLNWHEDENGNRIQAECREKMVIYFLEEGSLLPYVLMLPPTSIKSYRDYGKTLFNKGLPFSSVVTSMTLEKVKSDKGDVSVVKFKVSDIIQKKDNPENENEKGYRTLKPIISEMMVNFRMGKETILENNELSSEALESSKTPELETNVKVSDLEIDEKTGLIKE